MKSLADQRKSVINQAREIAEAAKAAGRQITPDELTTINGMLDAVKSLDVKISEAKAGDELIERLGRIDGDDGHDRRQQSGDSETTQYLDLSATGRKAIAESVAKHMVGLDSGRKALLPSGEQYVSIPTVPDSVQIIGQPVQPLLGLLPVIKIPAGSQARYMRQSLRTNNAAPVAPGATKPTSLYGITPIDVALKVYAHLSEPLDRFALEDAAQLAQFVVSELTFGLFDAVERDVVNGAVPVPPAVGIVGILKTSGIRTQPFSTDILTTTRAAIATSEGLGYADSLVFVLSPADWAAAQLLQAQTGGGFLMPGAPNQMPAQTLWGVPVSVSNGLPAKTGLLLNRSGLALYTDSQGNRIDWGTPGSTWSANQIVARCEGRFDLAVLRPAAQVQIGTAA